MFNIENGYRIKLSPDELKEQEKDRKADERLSERLLQESEPWMSLSKTIKPLVSQENNLLNSCKSLGIKDYHGATTISSMTYVQNPNYRGALRFFRRALDCANLDISKIDQLLYLDEIGILDIPIIYERWCLLMIIRVLCEHYDFTPLEKDKEDLFDTLVREWRSDKMLSIMFKNKNLARDILLEYEQTLPNGRRPDFILKVINRSNSDSQIKVWH